jgi:flagellar basal-body rod protein FlgF
MSQALFSTASGATHYEKRLDVLANNLANINTAGYKQDKLVFRIPKEEAPETKVPEDTGFLYSPPPIPAGTTVDYSPGTLKATGNPLDLALHGDGFFCVESPGGTWYTRKGHFSFNQDGVMVTKEGHPVQGKNGPIKVFGQDVRIDENGNVYADGEEVDTVKVVDIRDRHHLRKMGDALFAPTQGAAQEIKDPNVVVKQGFLEESNVNGLRAMTEMIEVMRGYESYQKIIQYLDDVRRRSISDVGKL